MKSPENGTAELKARHPLNCESTEKYELSIAAVACNGLVSDRSVKTSQKNKTKTRVIHDFVTIQIKVHYKFMVDQVEI